MRLGTRPPASPRSIATSKMPFSAPRGSVGALRVASPLVGVMAVLVALAGCNYRHAAPVQASDLPPPPGDRQVHSSPLLVEVHSGTDDSQCVAYEGYRTLCFHEIRPALEKSLTQGLWAAFPSVRTGRLSDAGPSEYVLQLDVQLDALPPGEAGPGWSAGLQGRWRLLRDGVVLAEEALASRSRAEFPYGAALGQAGTEVIDAVGTYVVAAVSSIEETRPLPTLPLPAVAARSVHDGNLQAPPRDATPKAPPGDARKAGFEVTDRKADSQAKLR